MSDRGPRRGWIVAVAGAVLLAGLVAARIALRRNPTTAPTPTGRSSAGTSQSGTTSPGKARPEEQRVREQAALLDRLRRPPEGSPDPPVSGLRLEAAQHPDQYHSLLRSILRDPAIDESAKRAALLIAEIAVNLKTLEAVYEYVRAAGGAPMTAAAVEALGRVSAKFRQDHHLPVPQDYLDALEKLRAHEAAAVRSAAHTALWRVARQDFNDEQIAAYVRRVLEDPDPFVFGAFYHSLLGSNGLRGRTVEEELTRQFSRFSDPHKRAAIITALGTAARDATPALLAVALTDADPRVRREAIAAIGRLKDASLLPTLKVMLEDEAQNDAATRRALIKCLAGFGSSDAALALARYAVGAGDRAIRDEALASLQSAKGVKGDEELSRLLVDRMEKVEDPQRRMAFLFALGTTGTREAAETLRKEFGKVNDPDQREGILRAALGVTQDDAFALLAEGLPHVSVPSLRRGVLEFLSRHKRPELIPALHALVNVPAIAEDADYRIDLIDAAVKVGSPAAAAFVRDMAGREKDEEVRKRLQEALGEFKN